MPPRPESEWYRAIPLQGLRLVRGIRLLLLSGLMGMLIAILLSSYVLRSCQQSLAATQDHIKLHHHDYLAELSQLSGAQTGTFTSVAANTGRNTYYYRRQDDDEQRFLVVFQRGRGLNHWGILVSDREEPFALRSPILVPIGARGARGARGTVQLVESRFEQILAPGIYEVRRSLD